MSALALSHAADAASPPVFSPSWFAARTAAGRGAAAASSGIAAPIASQRNVAQSLIDMSRSAAMIRNAATQQALAQLRGSLAAVPNGLVAGGLVPATGASAEWTNAQAPTQGGPSDQPTVTIKQTGSQAILNWASFNVGARTTLAFDQSAGGTNASGWVTLNRVTDPTAEPSRILGSIVAPGKVFVLNRNGVIFGTGAQVNVGALIAASASLSDAQLAANGIYSGTASDGTLVPSFTGASAAGAIVVEQGAHIQTAASSSVLTGGGAVLLLGGSVRNDGQIDTPGGQTVLAAGQDFILKQGYSVTQNADGTLSGNRTSTTLGTEVTVAAGTGTVTNAGLITATTGDISLVAHTIAQNGVVVATTSVNQRGTVHLLTDTQDTTGTVTLGPGSLTTVQLDTSGATAFDSRRAGLIGQSAQSNPLLAPDALPDRLDQSRIEITTGGLADFADGSLTMAQGGRVAITAGKSVFVGAGAAIDTSGVVGVSLPASANTIVVNIQGFEQRDSPVNRDTAKLNNSNVTLDTRDLVLVPANTGGYPTDRYYTRGGLLEVSGYLNTAPHGIAEWASVGGTIEVSSPAVVAQPSSVLNVAGGSINYQAGTIGASYLIGPGGKLYNVATAPADLAYTGVYGGETHDHPHWGVTDTYRNPLIAPTQVAESAYTAGRDAGAIIIRSPTAILDGDIDAGVVTGPRQVASRPAVVPGVATDGYTVPQSAAPLGGTLDISNPNVLGLEQTPLPIDVRIADQATSQAAALSATDAVPTARVDTAWLTPGQITGSGLSSLTIVTAGHVQVLDSVSLAPGGTISIVAPVTDLVGRLVAPSATVVVSDALASKGLADGALQLQLDGQSGVTLHPGGGIDVAGLWSNAYADPAHDRSGAGFINGGSVSLTSARSVVVGAGSTIDVSAGAALSATAAATGGLGGNLTLQADTAINGTVSNQVTPGVTASASVQPGPSLMLDGVVRGFGVTGGGTLSLAAPAIQIGVANGTPASGTLVLPTSVTQLGFARVVLNGHQSVTVTAGTTLSAAAPSYQLALADTTVPSGSDPADALPLLLPPLYELDPEHARVTQRAGVSLVLQSSSLTASGGLRGGPIQIGAGALIAVDPGRSVTLETTAAQITVLGTISAPGGTIALLQDPLANVADITAFPDRGLSVWLGPASRLDVAGRAVVGLDTVGRPYGLAPDGGVVTIGSAGTLAADAATSIALPNPALGFVAIRPGAVIDASAASATIDQLAGLVPGLNPLAPGQTTSPVLLAGNGGTVAIASGIGVALDGTVIAPGGGPQAAGGTLGVALQTPVTFAPLAKAGIQRGTIDPALLVPRQVTLTQAQGPLIASTTLQPGDPIPAAAIGQALLSTYQIAAGGFGSVALSSTDTVAFAGPVSLALGTRLELSAAALVDTKPNQIITLSAPYVAFGIAVRGAVPVSDPSGQLVGRDFFYPGIAQAGTPSTAGGLSGDTMAGTLAVSGDLVQGSLQIGIDGVIFGAGATPTTIDLPALKTTRITSSGDLRAGTIQTTGDLSLTAAQVVPLANPAGTGNNLTSGAGTISAGGTLSLARSTSALPAPPLDLAGTLALQATTIEQGGIVRAPLGQIIFTGAGGNATVADEIDFLPGSLTSVSASGVTTLFGGTTDGVNFTIRGKAVDATQVSKASAFALTQTLVSTAAKSVSVSPGATLDLSGGGTIQGAGFITGRGGSTDTLLSPVLRFNPASASAPRSTNAVYAIVAGVQPEVGAATPALQLADYGNALPPIGQQIVLSQDAGGLKAGTYTLLPAYYALLPGGYRVEISTSATRVVSPTPLTLGDGSVVTSAITTVDHTAIRGALPVQVTLTSGAGVRDQSQYDEETLTQFTLAQSALFGQTRGGIPADGGLLLLQYPTSVGERTAFSFGGTALFKPGPDGISGAAAFDGLFFSSQAPTFEVVASGGTSTPGFVTLQAPTLNALDAPRLSLGGFLANSNAAAQAVGGPSSAFQSNGALGVVVRGGATLSAGEVLLLGSITLDSGAVIDTIGAGPASYDSTLVGAYSQNAAGAVLAVSNGFLRFKPASNGAPIEVDNGATLLSEGTIGFVTTGQPVLQQNVLYGTRNISFATATANIGSAAALNALDAKGLLPAGLDLSAEVLASLLRGDASVGAPALQRLTLTASQSVNFIGSINLDTAGGGGGPSLQQFVLNTPAIYGSGGASDAAVLSVGTLYWNGLADPNAITPRSILPGGPIGGGPGSGSGTLVIRATDIVLGSPPDDQPNNQLRLDRVTFGFDQVDLSATDAIEGNNLTSLSVYRQQAGIGFTGTGGTLSLATPLLTGAPGSVLDLTAGAAVLLAPPAGSASSAAVPDALGAEIHIAAPTATLDSAVVLPSGRLTVTTGGDLLIGAGARLDVAGQPKAFFDQTKAGWGGTIALESTTGSIRLDAESSVDISAVGADAGSLSAIATAGTVDLAGPIAGSASAGFAGATLDARAGVLPDFAGLNARLDQGGVTGERAFDIKTGDLVVQDAVTAHVVAISVDGGALTIDGPIDASGPTPGSIRLAGAGGLTLTGRASLDAHATVPQVDSYGAPIDAENRASITLIAGGPATAATPGTLTIANGAALDVSAAQGVACLLGTAACGTIELDAPRLAGGDVAISVGSLSVRGAQSIAVIATTHDVPTDGTIVQTNLTTNGGAIDAGAIGLDQINAANVAFITAALPGGALNAALAGRLSGLTGPYAAQLHLRPGVEIDSPAANPLDPDGSLFVPGDLDLSGLRYASLNPASRKTAVYGSGEPGSLIVRASGSLVVNGSVTDGFAPPPDPTVKGRTTINPSGNGWLLYSTPSGSVQGQEPFGADIVLPYSLPAPVSLLAGTTYQPNNTVLGYDIAIGAATIQAGQILPQAVTLASDITLTNQIVATGQITAPGPGLPSVIQKGQIIPAGTTIAAGATLGAGTLLPVALPIQAGIWQRGGNLDLFTGAVSLTATATLGGGSLIPSGTQIVIAGTSLPTRPTVTGGVQGQIWGAAPMLAEGSLSWSLRLVSGADLGAADSRALLPASQLEGGGDLILSDTHYTLTTGRRNRIVGINPSFSVIRTGTGDLDLLSGGAVTETSLWGIYTAGSPSPALGGTISGGPDTLDQGRNVYDLARGQINGSVLGPNGGAYESLVNASSDYTAYYPQGGGNVTLVAQGDITGDIHDGANFQQTGDTARESGAVSNWLWLQGGGTAVNQPTAWWINPGTYVVNPDTRQTDYAALVGFVGVGTLGGGNVSIRAGGTIGPATDRGDSAHISRTGGLDAAVASSGRVVDGQVVQTGGGALSISAGGAINPFVVVRDDGYGTWTNMRGSTAINAGSIGQVTLNFNNSGVSDPRALTNTAEQATGTGGPVLVLGDTVANIETRRDLTLSGVGDPGRILLDIGTSPNLLGWNTTPFVYQTGGTSVFSPGGGNSFFSMWQPSTGIELTSAGGNITPFTVDTADTLPGVNDRPTSSSAYFLPGSLGITALDGSIYNAPQPATTAPLPFELAPSPIGQLDLFAGGSIYNVAASSQTSRAIDMSGAPVESVASIVRPAFNNETPVNPVTRITNADPGRVPNPELFAFTDPDTPSGLLHQADPEPMRVYALQGDVVGLRLGEQLTLQPTYTGPSVLYLAAKPEDVRAGRDIVLAGTPTAKTIDSPLLGYTATGNFILNLRQSDVSVVAAGRDVIFANIQVAGPGSLLVQAGRNLYQGNQGVLESVGPVINPDPQSRNGGAGILALAGVGAAGPDWSSFAQLYLDADNLAVAGTVVGQGVNAARVAETYATELLDWLRRTYGYTGTQADALAAFLALPSEQQAIFLAPLYFDELRLSGREFNDPTSVRSKSYARGREAIATLFPASQTYNGSLTLFSGLTVATDATGAPTGAVPITDGGIRTDRGGALAVLDPGGGVTVGVTGINPGADAGLLTQGSGDIDIFARDSVLLGQSRVFTTFGGGITVWSAQGDINAGRGAKTTVVSAPEQIIYDDTGTVLLSPTAPTTGAGIATLNPIPSVPPGDVDLIAPLGVIDAGEAGIRASGNANLAALTIVNAGNIQVQGKTTGVPVVAVPNLGALTAAQAAAGAAQNSADQETQRKRRASETIVTVEVIGFGP